MDHLTPGYYWVIRKNRLQENWSKPKPEYLDESLIEVVREGNYDLDSVCVLGKVLTFFEAEDLKRKLDSSRREKVVLEHRVKTCLDKLKDF